MVKLSEELRELEERLLQPETRHSVDELHRLLAEDFREFGSSGKIYGRGAVISALTAQRTVPSFALEDFEARWLAAEIALVTYRVRAPEGDSLRSSLWRRGEAGWQMVFHQGTSVR